MQVLTENLVDLEMRGVLRRIDDVLKDSGGDVRIGSLATSRSTLQKYIMSGETSVIQRMILDACFRAEALGPGSADLVFEVSTALLKNHSAKAMVDNEHKVLVSKKIRESLDKEVIVSSRRPDIVSLSSALEGLPHISQRIASEAIKLGNPFSTYKVSRGNISETSSRKIDGYNFHVTSPVSAVTGKSSAWDRYRCDVVVIDGIVESVSELHHLFEMYSASGRPLCIVCREVKPEIVTTIRHNNLRGTLDVTVCTFGYDEIRANLLVDAAVCVNGDVVSSMQGDLISTAHSKVVTVDRVVISDSLLTVYNSGSSSRVAEHRTRLEKKISESDQATGEMIEKRLPSLISDSISITVGISDMSSDPSTIENLDRFFRTLRSLLSHGYLVKEDIDDLIENNEIFRGIDLCKFPSVIPTASFLSFLRYTQQLLVDLILIGAIVKS